MQSNVLRFPHERVQGRRIVLETQIYRFEHKPPMVAVMPARAMATWLAWSVLLCAAYIAFWGR